MARGLLDRASSRAEDIAAPPPPLRLLDRALDRELTEACALVGRAVGTGTQVILEAAVGAHPVTTFWAACDVRAAELCTRYGVELLLVEEDGRIRIRVDQYHAAALGPPSRSRRHAWWRWRWPGAKA
jgi:hypothetical protein